MILIHGASQPLKFLECKGGCLILDIMCLLKFKFTNVKQCNIINDFYENTALIISRSYNTDKI